MDAALLLAAAFGAGALNAVAGGGRFLTLLAACVCWCAASHGQSYRHGLFAARL